MSSVQVKVELVPGGGGRTRINVHVQSLKNAKVNGSTSIDPSQATGQQHLVALVSAAGGACAEWLNERYGENHVPGECSRLAAEDFNRECLLMAELKQGIDKKVAVLRRGPLRPIERELVDRLNWKLKRGNYPTEQEATLVDKLLMKRSRAR